MVIVISSVRYRRVVKQHMHFLLLLSTVVVVAGCDRSETTTLTALDVGTVVEGPPITQTFRVKNGSEQPFHIVNVAKSCACQGAIFDSEAPVKPGGKASITVEVPTKGREGRNEYHFLVKTDSEDQDYAAIPLVLTATIRSKLKVVPSELSFGTIAAASDAHKKLVVSSLDMDPKAKLISFDVIQDYPVLRVGLCNSSAASTLAFDVRIFENAPVGDLNATLVLTFADKDVPKIEVPISGRIEGAIIPTPRLIVTSRGQDFRSVIRLVSRSGEAFKVLDTSLDSSFQLTPVSIEDTECLYRLSCSSSAEPGRYTLLFRTNHPSQGTLSLPIIVHE